MNADQEVTWEETLDTLRQLEIPLTFEDRSRHTLTTAFAQVSAARLRQIAKRPWPFLKGHLSFKIILKPMSPAATELQIYTQIRQSKGLRKKEKLLKSNGRFEKFIAYQISSQSVKRQYPWLTQVRLGMAFIPEIQTGKYRIRYIEDPSPAQEAGFKDGDILMKIDGRSITIQGELFEALFPKDYEKKMEMEVIRARKTLVIPVWIFKLAGEDPGMVLKLEASKKRFFVKAVKAGSPAARSGLKAKDQLMTLQGKPLENWTDYYRALAAADESEEIRAEAVRQGEKMTFMMTRKTAPPMPAPEKSPKAGAPTLPDVNQAAAAKP